MDSWQQWDIQSTVGTIGDRIGFSRYFANRIKSIQQLHFRLLIEKPADEFIATALREGLSLERLGLGTSGPQKSERVSTVSQFGDSMA
jgi:hypothetical protein